ncbi:MAG: hypothetical protein P8X62_09265 [Flavobacteriaceae bacterium]
MKFIYSILFLTIFLIACQPKVDNSAEEAFKKNSETVLANLQGFQDENVDYYSTYSDSVVFADTGFGGKDSLSLDDIKENDKWLWETFNFKLITDPLVLLPGVDPETKKSDGSVRYYGEWELTLPATDSTEGKTAVLKMYESYDFDDDGKILYQQGYGDFTGIMTYLLKEESSDEMAEEASE